MLTHAVTLMTLEDVMLSEIQQTQKDKCCVIPPWEVLRTVEILELEPSEL